MSVVSVLIEVLISDSSDEKMTLIFTISMSISVFIQKVFRTKKKGEKNVDLNYFFGL